MGASEAKITRSELSTKWNDGWVAEDPGPLVEGQVGGDQDGAPLVALAEDLEKQFRAGAGEWDEAQFVDDQQIQTVFETWRCSASVAAASRPCPLATPEPTARRRSGGHRIRPSSGTSSPAAAEFRAGTAEMAAIDGRAASWSALGGICRVIWECEIPSAVDHLSRELSEGGRPQKAVRLG